MPRFFPAALAALVLLALPACGTPEEIREEPPAVQEQESPQPQVQEPDPEPTAEELAAQAIDDLLSSLTLEEKVGQLFFVRCPETKAVEDIST